jgi:hypothetical protein
MIREPPRHGDITRGRRGRCRRRRRVPRHTITVSKQQHRKSAAEWDASRRQASLRLTLLHFSLSSDSSCWPSAAALASVPPQAEAEPSFTLSIRPVATQKYPR